MARLDFEPNLPRDDALADRSGVFTVSQWASFRSGFRWMALGRLGAQLASWVGTLLVMRLLSPGDYGLAAICSAVIAVVTLLAEFGFGAALVQAQTLSRAQIRSVFGAALLFSWVSALVVVAGAPLAGWFFRSSEAVVLIQASALQLLLSPLATVPDAFLKRELRFKGASLVELLAGFAATIVTVSMAYGGTGVWALIIGPVAGTIVRIVLLHGLARQVLLPSFRIGPARELVRFGRDVALSRLASYVFGQSDVLIAGRTLDKVALGEYSVAMHLAMLPVTKVMGIVNQVAYPVIAQMAREGHDLRPDLLRGLRLSGYALIPGLWGVAAVAPWFVHVVLGPQWSSASVPLQIVCLVLPLRLMSVLMSTAVQGIGRPDIDLFNSARGVVLLPVCFLVGSLFGAAGLACGWLVGLPLLLTLNIRNAREVLGFTLSDALRQIALPLVCSGGMFFAVRALAWLLDQHASSVLGLVVMMGFGMVFYAALVWVFDRAAAFSLMSLVREG
jgi:teichuronic acid exporter